MSKLKFHSSRSLFLETTRKRVDNYFAENALSKNGNWLLWLKSSLFLFGFFTTYLLIISDAYGTSTLIILAAALGIFSAFIGFNICHDASHGSFSSSKFINLFFSHFLYLIGANPYMWNITHNIVHHTYTNIPGHDEDLEIAPGLLRLSEDIPLNRLHRFQHLYAIPLYSLASLSCVLRKDFKKFFQPKIGHFVIKHPKVEFFKLFFYKILYLFLFIGMPILFMELSWWKVLIGFLIMHFAQGISMGLVFQLAHVVEVTDFPSPNSSGIMEEVWADHQMRTTANFASNSLVAAFLLGGLNRQIEHHLFPKICHIHYAEIGKIVKQTAAEFDVPYLENATFLSAIRSHYRMLKLFGIQSKFGVLSTTK